MQSIGYSSLTFPLSVSMWIKMYQTFEWQTENFDIGGNVLSFVGSTLTLAIYRIGVFVNGCYANNWGSAGYTQDVWMHITMTVQSTGTKVYVNGVESASCSNVPNVNDMKNIQIGQLNDYRLYGSGFSGSFAGYIDDIRVYDYVLSTAQISALGTPQIVLTCPPGFTRQAGSCEACPVSTFKPLSGDFACIGCETGSYTDSTGASSCSCSAGYLKATDIGYLLCTECPSGKYKSAAMQSCVSCAIGTYSVAGADQCTSCASGYRNDIGSQTNVSQCYFCDIPPPGSCKPAIHFPFDSYYSLSAYNALNYGQYWFPNKGYLGSKFDAEILYSSTGMGYPNTYRIPELSSDSQIGMSFRTNNRGAWIRGDFDATSDWSVLNAPIAFSLYFKLSMDYTSGRYPLLAFGFEGSQPEVFRLYGDSNCIRADIGPTDGRGYDASTPNKGVYNAEAVTVSYCWEDYGLSTGPKIPFTNGVWYSVLATVENNQNNFGVISLYIDGALKGTATSTFTIAFTTAQKKELGNW